MTAWLYLKKQRSHSFPTLYLSPHRCGRNKAEWNLSKYCLLNLPFHFSAGCCCRLTSVVQIGLSSGQSLLTAPFPPPLMVRHQSLYCLTETSNLPLLLPTWSLSGLCYKGLHDDISSCHLLSACKDTHVETTGAQTYQSKLKVFTFDFMTGPSQIRD